VSSVVMGSSASVVISNIGGRQGGEGLINGVGQAAQVEVYIDRLSCWFRGHTSGHACSTFWIPVRCL
jgi:hypothetical protein